MIRHLNPEGFRPYGIIVPTGGLSQKPNHHSVFLPEGSVSAYRTVAPLWLGSESGLTVLSVSIDGNVYEDFYLDKALRLNGGVYFQLTGIGGKASVQMGGVSMPLSLGKRVNVRDFAVRPKVRVECLYTLFYQEKEAGFVFPGENHPMAEIMYVDKGSLHSVADGQDLSLEQGDLVLYAPEQWHMQYADADQAPCMVTIGFWARGIRWDALSNRKFTQDKQMSELLRQILRAQEQGYDDSIFSLLTLLLLYLQDKSKSAEEIAVQPVLSGENAIIRSAQQYIQANIEEKLTVPAVAGSVEVSPSYLTALFHKHLQISPGEYIRRIKLGRSKQLIREGQMNFTQISENLQYSTVHHFSRQFKQMFGMTPTEYAKSVR